MGVLEKATSGEKSPRAMLVAFAGSSDPKPIGNQPSPLSDASNPRIVLTISSAE